MLSRLFGNTGSRALAVSAQPVNFLSRAISKVAPGAENLSSTSSAATGSAGTPLPAAASGFAPASAVAVAPLPVANSTQRDAPLAPITNAIGRELTGTPMPDSVRVLRTTYSGMIGDGNSMATTATLSSHEDIESFISSKRFKRVTKLYVPHLDRAKLSRLIDQLAAHPSKALTLHIAPASTLGSDLAKRLTALPIKGLHLDYESQGIDIQVLESLNKSQFPIALRGNLSRDGFFAASRIPTLTTLDMTGRGLDDKTAQLFASHESLQSVFLGVNWNLSSQGVGAIAAIPTLRNLSIDDWSPRWVSADVARTLAASRRFESLDIRSKGPAVPSVNFSMLCESKTLKTLRIPSAPSMPYLSSLRSLEHLELHNDSFRGIVCLDPTSARVLTSLPKLQSLRLSSMYFRGGALAAILTGSRVQKLEFHGYHWFHEGDILALSSNKHVKELAIKDGYLPAADIAALLSHPSLDRFCINKLEFVRLPGAARLTLQEENAVSVRANVENLRSRL